MLLITILPDKNNFVYYRNLSIFQIQFPIDWISDGGWWMVGDVETLRAAPSCGFLNNQPLRDNFCNLLILFSPCLQITNYVTNFNLSEI